MLSHAAEKKSQETKSLLALALTSAASLVISLMLAFFISQGITRPINHAVARLKDIAQGEGDLTQRLEVATRDEVGEMATWFNTFLGGLQAMIKDIADNAATLSSASAELTSISQQMAAGAGQTAGKASTVATAAEEMSANNRLRRYRHGRGSHQPQHDGHRHRRDDDQCRRNRPEFRISPVNYR